jgi:arylsulfatase A-like enzyme
MNAQWHPTGTGIIKMKSMRWVAALILAVAVGPCLGSRNARAQSTQHPNIIYILADDLGWKDVGFHGSDIKTPNLDQLAQNGARLEQFYVQPMCTPTRAALMTGRYPFRYGLQTLVIPASMNYGLPTDEWLLPQALSAAGYTTAIIGKWHLGHGQRKFWPRARGFDYQYGALVGEIDYFKHTIGGKIDWYRDGKLLKEQGYVTALLGEDAVRFIDRQDANKPFFIYLAFTAPHTPFQAPQKYLDMYQSVTDVNRRSYAAMITAMDDQIGAVVQELQKRGLRQNTLIIFHSDNGGNQSHLLAGESEVKGHLPADNGPYRGGKGDLYEGGTRVASLINWPGKIKPGTIVDQMMHVVDYYPTLVKLAGGSLDKAKPLDGFDMWPTISDGQPSPRKEVVYNVEIFRGAVRQGNWKLFWRATLPSKLELFNLANDPAEKNNIVDHNSEKAGELRNRINDLASAMAKSLLMEEVFKGVVKQVTGQPPALPNEDGFYEGDVSGD